MSAIRPFLTGGTTLPAPVPQMVVVESCLIATQQFVYTHAEISLPPGTDVVSLVFKSQIANSFQQFASKFHSGQSSWKQDLLANPSVATAQGRDATIYQHLRLIGGKDDTRSHSELNGIASDQLVQVRRVLVNLTIPALTGNVDEDTKWAGLIGAIGATCKHCFPNLDPGQSSFIVHRGFERFHADEKLI